jgi:hypothetical protein
MPTPISNPAVGLKHSETPDITVLAGDEKVLALRPTVADPTKFENVNVPVALIGTPGTPGQSFTGIATETVGGVQRGDTFTTNDAGVKQILITYQAPGFSSFALAGTGGRTVPVGTQYPAGFKSFTWSTTNSGNVTANSLQLWDVTAQAILASNEANDGTLSASTAAFTAALGESRRYRLTGRNSNGNFFTADLSISGAYQVYAGAGSQAPTTSAQVRALPIVQLAPSGLQFTINTGTTATVFALYIPPGRTLQSIIDLDALNKDVTGEYAAGTQSVNDEAGAPVAYVSRIKIQAQAYAVSHRHLVTLS